MLLFCCCEFLWCLILELRARLNSKVTNTVQWSHTNLPQKNSTSLYIRISDLIHRRSFRFWSNNFETGQKQYRFETLTFASSCSSLLKSDVCTSLIRLYQIASNGFESCQPVNTLKVHFTGHQHPQVLSVEGQLLLSTL